MNFIHLRKLRPIRFGQRYPLFTRVSLETTKTCTRACSFCPSVERGKLVQTMPDELYAKILYELGELQFSGVVQWFFVNEPLIDKNHLVRIAQLRAACRRVTIHVTTNWDVMHKRPDEDQLIEIDSLFAAGVNSLNLNDYDHRGYERIVKLAGKRFKVPVVNHNWKKLRPTEHVLSCGPLPEKLHSWTGYVSDTVVQSLGLRHQTGKSYCPRPMRHIVVMYNGQVPLCCAVNPTGAEILGDVNKQSLVDIWNNRRFFEYRKKLQEGIREEQCKNCDASVAYPHVVRRVSL